MSEDAKGCLLFIGLLSLAAVMLMLGAAANTVVEQYAKHTWPEKQCVEKVER